MSFKIQAHNYTSEVTKLSDHILKVDRYHIPLKEEVVDTFSCYWSLGFADFKQNGIKIKSAGEWVNFEGPCAIFIPSYSIINWKLDVNSRIQWTAFFASQKDYPMQVESIMVSNRKHEIPINLSSLQKTIDSISSHGMKINECHTRNKKNAMNLKKWLDSNINEECLMQNASEYLKKPRTLLSREFSNCYGLSPSLYKHKSRTFQAMYYMNKGWSITDALYEVGYSDPSRFINQFKKLLSVNPNSYKLKGI